MSVKPDVDDEEQLDDIVEPDEYADSASDAADFEERTPKRKTKSKVYHFHAHL